MLSLKKLAVVVVFFSMLIMSSQPVFSQGQSPDLQQGIAEFNQENYDEAVDLLQKARNAQPDSSLPAYYLGVTYKKLENYTEAEKHLTDAVKLSPDIKEAIMELADVQYRLGEYQASLDTLKIAEEGNIRSGQTAFMKGLVLLEMDRNTEAVESFKKAGELSPELVQASNYQMGLALLKGNELEAARSRFNDVIAKDPNTDMAVFASSYLETIDKKKKEKVPYRFYLGYHLQYDDNVALKPSDSDVAVNISDDDDYRHLLTAGFEYLPERKGPIDYSAHYNLYYSMHDDLSEFDVQSHTFVIVPSYKLNKTSSADVALGYNYSLVDNDRYLSTVTISPTYTLLHGKNNMFQTYFSYQNKDFLKDPSNKDEDRDADNYSLSLNWYYFFKQKGGIMVPFMENFQISNLAQNKGYFNLLYKVNKEVTDGRNWEHFGNTGIATVLLNFDEKYKVSVSGEIKYQDYNNLHTVFDVERLDITYGFSTLFYYRIHEYANIQLLYSYRRDDSNISIYDYDRNLYSIGVELKY